MTHFDRSYGQKLPPGECGLWERDPPTWLYRDLGLFQPLLYCLVHVKHKKKLQGSNETALAKLLLEEPIAYHSQ